MSNDLDKRRVVAEAVHEPDFFLGFSGDEEAILRDIWSDLLNSSREIAFAKSSQPVKR